jgi:hypothetical protein
MQHRVLADKARQLPGLFKALQKGFLDVNVTKSVRAFQGDERTSRFIALMTYWN